MKANIELRQARNFGEIINDSILFVTQNWKPLLKTFFVFCGFFMAGNVIFSILMQLKIVAIHKNNFSDYRSSPISFLGVEYLMVLLFSFLNIISIITTSLCYVALYKEKGNQPPGVAEVWVYFKYYFLRVTYSVFMLGLILVVAAFICMIPGIFFLTIAGSMVGGFISFFCVLLPMAYFITVLTLLFPIMIMENGGLWYSFGKCFRLIKSRWWNTFGVVFVTAIVVYAAYLLVALLFGVASGGSIQFLAYNVNTYIIVIYSIVISLMQAINILPMVTAGITYFSYVEEKESLGLWERINALGQAAATTTYADETPDEY
jgi:hypothetical protein